MTTAIGQEHGAGPDVPDYVAFTQGLPNGLTNVAALDLPQAFVERVADRSMRSHFRRQYRQVEPATPFLHPIEVVQDGKPREFDAPFKLSGSVMITSVEIPPELLEPWMPTRSDVPELRGFRAPFVESGQGNKYMIAPLREDGPKTRAAALYVAEHLAKDGLVRTTLDVLPMDGVIDEGVTVVDNESLAYLGIPVDLLAMFRVDGKPMLDAINAWWKAGAKKEDVAALAARAVFAFTPSRAGFEVMAEDGTRKVSTLRTQLPAARYLAKAGDGSPLDVVRQLAMNLSHDIVVSINKSQADELLAEANMWDSRASITIVPTVGSLTQWAQDNAKPGETVNTDGTRAAMTLLPRFACINEQMSKCVLGDTFLFETLRTQVGGLVPSPLLFQGGNVMCVTLPADGRRLLLVGEAEVQRNRALGLSEGDVLDAFRLEFGVDEVVVIPAESFHLDMEFTIRKVDDDLIVVMGDDLAAARIILAEALRCFVKAELLHESAAQPAIDELASGAQREALTLFGRTVAPTIQANGAVGKTIVDALRATNMDEPEANARRVLYAMDLLAAYEARSNGQSLSATFEFERMYRESLLRRLDEREALARTLAELGMTVKKIPNLGDEELGVNYLNALHLPDSTLVPVMGGFFAPLDDAALASLHGAFGTGVKLTPIVTTQLQSNYGGVHCMVSAYPAAD